MHGTDASTKDDPGVRLRDTEDADFAIFFEYRADPVARTMAAFGTRDASASDLAARWKANTAGTVQKTVVSRGAVVGFAATFFREDKLQVTYWIDRAHWGRGIATRALEELLRAVPARPIYASAAADNAASLRVLQKCGFVITGSARAFAEAREGDVDEVFLELR